MKNTDLVFVGIKGSAIALSRATGEISWQTHLTSSGFVHLVLEGDNLYATTQGEVFCLNPATGEGRWHNKLKGYGLGLASIAVGNVARDGGLALVAAEQASREQQSSAAAVTVA